MKLKNPIKLWKEPVTTFEEVEQRKKDLKPWIIISAILCLVTIGIFMLMYFGFLYYIVNKINKKFEALTCSNCSEMAIFKTKEEFEKYVTYSIIGGKANYHGINHPSANNGIISYVEAKASATATVVISLTCPHCGAVKKLEYIITPFICSSKEEKIFVRDLELVKIRLEQSVKEVVEIFNDPLRHHLVPYSIQSVNHPNYENRGKLQLPSSAYGYYNGVEIKYHRDVEELVEGFFVHNELNGKIVDHNKKNKKAIKNKSKQEVIKSESTQEEILNDNTKLNDQDLVNGINRKNSKKKKPLVLLIIAIIVVALIIGGVVLYFKLKHTHDYINEITYPTCEEIGFIEYRCACGDSYLSDIILG